MISRMISLKRGKRSKLCSTDSLGVAAVLSFRGRDDNPREIMKEGQPSLTAKVELKTRRLGYEAVTHPCLLAIMGPLIPRFANPRISNALRYARSPSLCSPCIVPLLIKPSPFLPHPALHLDLGFTE